ncbi:hypothetical protein PR202_ga19089 [Eleusine coracana subsp. coracana]|uniref:EGF-like domain-containing protein n=1 Tax=Eleusine coracana subsp. coracana TaxID=191504 RepID=A0AAV5CV08_ELECO|nr:hypothetical protein PR202_ga19089 [Eleusine coracana subsp. coracana]
MLRRYCVGSCYLLQANWKALRFSKRSVLVSRSLPSLMSASHQTWRLTSVFRTMAAAGVTTRLTSQPARTHTEGGFANALSWVGFSTKETGTPNAKVPPPPFSSPCISIFHSATGTEPIFYLPYITTSAVGPGRCAMNNAGCWSETRHGKTFSACSNTWGGFDCKCGSGMMYIKSEDTCIAKNMSAFGWLVTVLVLSCLAGAGIAGYVFYKYRLRRYMDSEVMAIMAQYMPLESQHNENEPLRREEAAQA